MVIQYDNSYVLSKQSIFQLSLKQHFSFRLSGAVINLYRLAWLGASLSFENSPLGNTDVGATS